MRGNFLVALSAVSLAACSGGGSDAPAPTTGELMFVNSTTASIHEVYVSESGSGAWGTELNAAAVPSGTGLLLTGLDPSWYDVRAVVWGAYSDYSAHAWDRPVYAGARSEVTMDAEDFSGSVRFFNSDQYGNDLAKVHFVPTTEADWGANRLPNAIGVSYAYELYDVPPGYYDVRCEFADGYQQDTYDVQIASLATSDVTCDGTAGEATWVLRWDAPGYVSAPDAAPAKLRPDGAAPARARYSPAADGQGAAKR